MVRFRSDNCIKNYYYSTLRKHLRRINKSLKQCQIGKNLASRPLHLICNAFPFQLSHFKRVAKRLSLKFKNLTAE